jgi:cell wall-associated NlpC family hydrolase
VTPDTPPDKRRHAYREDLAADSLREAVPAPRYAAGERWQVVHSAAQLRARPDPNAPWTTEALFGEVVTVYDRKDGWAWGQLESDGYVGYLREGALSNRVAPVTHTVRALGTFIYPEPDIKSPPYLHVSMTAALSIAVEGPVFCRLDDGRYIPSRHVIEGGRHAPDYVAVAERFVGAPYVWGGKTRLGLDCSGLVQVATHAAGRPCPRDSDMQQAEVGSDIAFTEALDTLERGDLVFWKGHVGIMTDAFMLLHANAHHMAVVIEPLHAAASRNTAAGAPIAAVRRPARKGEA